MNNVLQSKSKGFRTMINTVFDRTTMYFIVVIGICGSINLMLSLLWNLPPLINLIWMVIVFLYIGQIKMQVQQEAMAEQIRQQTGVLQELQGNVQMLVIAQQRDDAQQEKNS